MKKIIAGFLFLSLIHFEGSSKHPGPQSGYDLKKPVTTYTLPPTLNEISGITLVNDETIACIQDENGILFIYDILNSQIVSQHKFYIDGDYEGLARVGTTMYVLRSDGNIFEIDHFQSPDFKIKTYITGIPANNNEGLCYDRANNRLLIAPKSNVGKGAGLKDLRNIYAFDLATKKLDPAPAYSFDLAEIRKIAMERDVKVPIKTKKVGEKKGGEIKTPMIFFRASAIDIHPVTKKLYLLSAADHMFFIFNSKSELEDIEKLDEKLFNKPEGITFLENSDMLISNEAQDKRPTLLKFKWQGLKAK